jgi:hypothetical protein
MEKGGSEKGLDGKKNHKKIQNMEQSKEKIHKEEGRRHHDDGKKVFFRMKRKGERAFFCYAAFCCCYMFLL